MLLKKAAQNNQKSLLNLFFLIGKSSCTKFWWENKGFTPFVLFPIVAKLVPRYRQKKAFMKSHIYGKYVESVGRINVIEQAQYM